MSLRCLLNAACTWSAAQTFTLAPVFTAAAGTRTNLGLVAVASSGSASDLTSGTLAAARGGAGTITGALKGSGAGVVTQAACADLSDGGNGGCTTKVVSGSLTPTLAYDTPGTSSFAYTTQSGNYVCVAGVVSGWVRVVFTPTNGTASGHLYWTNPPYSTSTNSNNVNAGLGPPIAFTGGWSSIALVYTLVAPANGNLTFANNTGTSATFLTTANSTTGTSKEMVLSFSYLVSGGTC